MNHKFRVNFTEHGNSTLDTAVSYLRSNLWTQSILGLSIDKQIIILAFQEVLSTRVDTHGLNWAAQLYLVLLMFSQWVGLKWCEKCSKSFILSEEGTQKLQEAGRLTNQTRRRALFIIQIFTQVLRQDWDCETLGKHCRWTLTLANNHPFPLWHPTWAGYTHRHLVDEVNSMNIWSLTHFKYCRSD